MLNAATHTGAAERRLGRLYLYLESRAAGADPDKPFFGAGMFVDVSGHPWPDHCVVGSNNRPIGLSVEMLKELKDSVQAFRPRRRARGRAGRVAPTSRAEHFKRLAMKLGLVVSKKVKPDDVMRMARAGKAALRGPDKADPNSP